MKDKVQWHIEVLPVSKLKSHPKNPRKMSREQSDHLENLIKTYGLIDKPIVNKDLVIIGGHQRIRILKKMKTKNIECWVPDRQLEQAEIDHLCIGLNLNQGAFDYDCLANEWDMIDLLKWGFTEEQLLDAAYESEKTVDEEETAKEKKEENHTCPNCGHNF